MVRTGSVQWVMLEISWKTRILPQIFWEGKLGRSEPAFFPEDFTGMVIFELLEKVVCYCNGLLALVKIDSRTNL